MATSPSPTDSSPLLGKRTLATFGEDMEIQNHVELYGATAWNQLGAKLGHTTGRKVRDRWFNVLDPSINHTPLTPVEDARIVDLYKKSGSFTAVASNMPGRTSQQVKNRFTQLMRRMPPEERPTKPAILIRPSSMKTPSPKKTQPELRVNFKSEDTPKPALPPPIQGDKSIRFTFALSSKVEPVHNAKIENFRKLNLMLATLPDARKQGHDGWGSCVKN